MHENDGMLAPYRVLDLTSETGQPCGKLLADLGADVIKVEPPGGDPARRRPPFVDDDPDPEKGLYWLAYNANKRGVVLDLESPAGRARFERLATTADVVLESSAPGEMDRLGLSYERLAELNPGLVLVSITPFGQDGPYATYKGPDIVTWAMSGLMSVAGQPECPPAHLSDDAQSRFSACGDAAIAALLALAQRQGTGRGQHVDVAIRDAVARTTFQIRHCQISDDRWRDRRKSRVSDRSTPQPPPRSANASEPGTTVVARRARHGRRRGGERESTVAARRMRCRNATLTRSSRSRASGSSAASRRDGSARCSCSGTASSGATPCVR